MKLQILYHGACFDGVTSAAIFRRFFLERVESSAEVVFSAMKHGQGDPYGADHDATLWADHNAVLDFRYSPSPRLGWWCDHHHSTFIRPEHREHFEANPSPTHHFDPKAPSCAGLLGPWLAAEHDFDVTPFADHIRWADLIDSARFDSPAQAVKLAEPALQLMTLLESNPPQEILALMLDGFGHRTIADVHQEPEIQQALQPVLEQHHDAVVHFGRRLTVKRGVAYADLTADEIDGFNKFIPYHLHDGVRYTVILTCSSQRAKVSVGSNPWHRPDPLINIADLCARYGGGGHPVVGAVSMPPDQIEQARQASLEIAEVLRG